MNDPQSQVGGQLFDLTQGKLLDLAESALFGKYADIYIALSSHLLKNILLNADALYHGKGNVVLFKGKILIAAHDQMTVGKSHMGMTVGKDTEQQPPYIKQSHNYRQKQSRFSH